MLAEESLRQGDLTQTLAQLQDQVRREPAQPKLRIFLFQLLAVLGQWQRALTQLNVAGELDPGTLAMVQTYRAALQCEVLRAEVFAGKRSPLLFGNPEEWVALLLEALRLTAEGRYTASQPLRERALELAPANPGTLNGVEFAWVADADTRLGPMLEAIVNGNYYWIPFHRVRELRIEEPADLRDLVWAPAQFQWANGGGAVGLIPTRYPGSEQREDDGLRLARKTEWQDCGDEVFLGLGQRLLATDRQEVSLLEVRQLVLGEPGPETTDG